MNIQTQDKVKRTISNTAETYEYTRTLFTNSAALQTAQFHLAIIDNRLVMDYNSNWICVYSIWSHSVVITIHLRQLQ
jgi:hypothetical protein